MSNSSARSRSDAANSSAAGRTASNTSDPISRSTGSAVTLWHGLCGPGLLAHAITAKFADHAPVHRLAGQLARSGVAIASSTLGDWLFGASELLRPLYDAMHTRLLLSRVIHGDDMGVKLRVEGEQSHEEGAPVGVHR